MLSGILDPKLRITLPRPKHSSTSLEASKGGMKVGRIKDPLYKDSILGLPHLPSSHLLRPPTSELRSFWQEAANPKSISAPCTLNPQSPKPDSKNLRDLGVNPGREAPYCSHPQNELSGTEENRWIPSNPKKDAPSIRGPIDPLKQNIEPSLLCTRKAVQARRLPCCRV